MNAPVLSPFPRTATYRAISFTAFRVSDGGIGRGAIGRLNIGDVATLDEAVNAAKGQLLHKDQLAVREQDEITGAAKVHLFAIRRKSAATFVRIAGEVSRVQALYAEPICVLSGEVLG
jgi:hypothetical protein